MNLYYWLDNAFISFSDAPLKISLIIDLNIESILLIKLEYIPIIIPMLKIMRFTLKFLGNIKLIF